MHTTDPTVSPLASPTEERRGRVGNIVHDVKDRAGEMAHDVKDKASDVVHDVRDRAGNVMHSVRDRAGHLKTQSVEDLWTNTKEYVRDNPGKTVLVSLGIGFLVGNLLRRR